MNYDGNLLIAEVISYHAGAIIENESIFYAWKSVKIPQQTWNSCIVGVAQCGLLYIHRIKYKVLQSH